MPRIDPERLLKTLAPLLESSTGAIKSEKEVDKIYCLMSKFSRKLVSKCTYINILKASEPDVLDLFLQRGGWDMVLGWTVDAQSKQNYDLLKEIGGLLLSAPASVQRLKENELPKVLKSLSKDCVNEDIREIAKRVVAKWVAIAKHQEIPINNSTASNTKVLKVENLMGSESENVPAEFDISSFDITHADLNGIMDFNPEDFSKAVDQHLNEFSVESAGIVTNINNSEITNNTNKVKTEAIVGTNPVIKMEASSSTLQGEGIKKTPKILIKTIAGQKAVVQGVGSVEPSKQGEAPFCIIMRDGKPFLVRLKLASPNQVNQLVLQAPDEHNNKTTAEEAVSTEKKRRPRKDPSIVNARKGPGEKHVPNILKTYSKTKPTDSITISEKAEDSSPKVKTEKTAKAVENKSGAVKRPRSGSSKSAAAAAAAKKQADEEKLRDKIKQEKVILKKRAKDAAKQKQQDKDQETLKKLNLSSEPSKSSSSNISPGSMKFPKIPKKQSSFADAIGVPGAVESLIAVPDKSNKKSPIKSTSALHESIEAADGDRPAGKFYGKSEETLKNENSQERKHRVKVFTSKKSRSEDLLKDMTANVKNSKANNKSDSIGKETGSQSSMMGEKSAVVHSIIANAKPEKRPSTEGIEKPGDNKKQKLSDEKADAEKRKEQREIKAAKEKAKSAANVIKESSLFMDALTASTEPQKTMKRKRRLSSSNEKEALILVKPGRINSTAGEKSMSPTEEKEVFIETAVKPPFNFYRDTLTENDKDGESPSRPDTTDDNPMDTLNSKETLDDKNDEDDPYALTPTIYEGALKSALVIHRARNKPKKSVRWREEEEIKEVFTFELDEQERVNVTKQKDFMSMKEQEKAEEKEFLATNLKRRILGVDEVEEKMPWRKPVSIILPSNIENFPVISEEKGIQEEREKINLGVFLPPGSVLPDNPAEPDPMSPDINEKEKAEPRIIPMDDVLNVTKVFDKRGDVWPKPDGVPMSPRASKGGSKGHLSISSSGSGQSNFGIPNFIMNEMPPSVPPPASGFSQAQHPVVDFNNPWTNNFSAPPPNMLPNVGDMSGFQQIPGTMMRPPSGPPPMAFVNALNPFAYPVPNPVPNFPVGAGFPGNPTQMLPNNVNNRDLNRGTPHTPNRGGRGDSSRDYGDRDLRTSFRDRRDAYDSRNRDSYDSRTRGTRDHRSRDYDRDRRSPSPSRRRRDDRDRHGRDDKDYKDHDYRSRGRSGKKDTPCRYFRQGKCHSGSRCEFSHGDPADHSDKSRSEGPRARHSSPSLITSGEDEGGSSAPNSIASQFERRPSKDDGTTNFTDAPSSPTDADEIQEDPSLLLTPVSEPAKIIPVE